MITANALIENKDNIEEYEKNLTESDVEQVVNFLSEKNDTIRYAAFQLLQKHSQNSNVVYKHWQCFVEKLESENSYQRSIGLMLISDNARWDSENKFEIIVDKYLSHCNDEKFITSRQAIQSIAKWIKYKKSLIDKTVQILADIDVYSLKDTQRKLIITDIIYAFLAIIAIQPNEKANQYILTALTGGLLDKKTVTSIQKMM